MLSKPQVTAAICCQGHVTTTASHSWQTSPHSPAEGWNGLRFTLSTALISTQSDVVWIQNQLIIDDTSTNPVHSVRAICVLFKTFCLPPTLHRKCRFGCILWMYFFLDDYFGVVFFHFSFLFCILYCCYDFLCYLVVQMHQSVSADECSRCILCHITTFEWQNQNFFTLTMKKLNIYIYI